MRPELLVVDFSNVFHRAFHGFHDLTTAKGQGVGAIYGTILFLEQLVADFNPSFLIMAYDHEKGSALRKSIYEPYKANRKPRDPSLHSQNQICRTLFQLLPVPSLEIPGIEADDVIASVTDRFKQDADIIIVSGDKDMAQLVQDTSVKLYNPWKKQMLDTSEVVRVFGVRPDQFSDYLAITGDAADNFPGITGIGPVGACKLLQTYGSLDNVIANAHTIKGGLGDKFRLGLGSLQVSRQLAQLVVKPITLDLQDVAFSPQVTDNIVHMCNDMEFSSVTMNRLRSLQKNEQAMSRLLDSPF